MKEIMLQEFKDVDTDKDGTLTYKELLDYVSKKVKKPFYFYVKIFIRRMILMKKLQIKYSTN
jgi:hypothetical protein